MPIKTIIFDLGGVIVHYDWETERRGLAALCRDPALAYSRIPELWAPDDLLSGRTTVKAYHRRLVEELGAKEDFTACLRACTSAIGAQVSGMEELVDSLHGRFQLALLSNTTEDHWNFISERNPRLFAKLTAHFLSFQLGMCKPQLQIYQHVVSELGAKPDECLFIDDHEAYVAGARAVGLDAVLFVNSQQLWDELANRGLVEATGMPEA